MKVSAAKPSIVTIQMPSEEYAEYLRDKSIEYHQDLYGFANGYDNIVILAGYGAFLALWAGIAEDITQAARALCVVGIGVSLLSYIFWQIIQMLNRQRWEFDRAKAFEHLLEPEAFNTIWNEASASYAVRQNRELRLLWPATFGTSVILGIGSGAFLVSQAVAVALGWPQFTGKW